MKLAEIQELMHSFEISGIQKMEVCEKEFSLKLEKQIHAEPTAPVIQSGLPAVSMMPPEEIQEDMQEEEAGTWIQAPLVGTYYAARSADSKPFIEIGQKVKKGDVLCIIEAMKVMNEIHAPCDGIIRSILITNSSMVEFDQKMIRIGESS